MKLHREGPGKQTLYTFWLKRRNSKNYKVGFCGGEQETLRRRKQRLAREAKAP